MVDSIGSRPVSTSGQPVAVDRTQPATAVKPTMAETPQASRSDAAGLASEAAASPPVDGDRVALIRKAVADGTFPLHPGKIADRLIALRYDWHPDER